MASLIDECEEDSDDYLDSMSLHLLLEPVEEQVLAPPLNDNLQYHAFFLYHNNDRDWVLNVIERLESPHLGFHCCCQERDLSSRLSQAQGVLYGMKNALKTVVVLTPDFVSTTWSACEVVVSEVDVVALQKDVVVILLQASDMPDQLADLAYIDANTHDWWTKLLARLALPDDTPMTEETVLSMSSSLVGLTPGLQSGHLLVSLKSRCRCCGREVVDHTEVPDELIAHGIQVSPEEYSKAVQLLMSESKFLCHIWCYNLPFAMVVFTLFLGFCLAVIPVLEKEFIFHGSETGLEYVHGGVVWLCALTLYMLVTHIARRKMKAKTYRRLTHVNSTFIKYNILVGVENLGLADCNKYYLHFFYFELGPCLAYLQELLVNIEECNSCYTNRMLDNGEPPDADFEEHVNMSMSDNMTVLDNANITNTSVQINAEDVLLRHSGEYISLLITKKLDRPRRCDTAVVRNVSIYEELI